MLNSSFHWQCPPCNKVQWEDFADEEKLYKCKGCKRSFMLTFDVSVTEVEAYDEEKEIAASIILVTVGVSKDGGVSWVDMTINTRDLDPEASPIKPGWLLKHNGSIYRVYLHPQLKRLQTEKVAV